MRVVCGWCRHPTPRERCDYCGRDPAAPWAQRGQTVPTVGHEPESGRPALDARTIRLRYDAARQALIAEGEEPTVEMIAERLDRSPRTVRGWRERFGLQ